MSNPAAARIAEALRAAMKDQALNGSQLADAIERLAGERPGPMNVSRWLRGERPLIRVSPDLVVLARALDLDPVQVACDAIRHTLAGDTDAPVPERKPGDLRCPSCRSISRRAHHLVDLGDGDERCPDPWHDAGPNPHQAPGCTHPDRAGEGCPACCDVCNADGHRCEGCGDPVGHRTRRCPGCRDDVTTRPSLSSEVD